MAQHRIDDIRARVRASIAEDPVGYDRRHGATRDAIDAYLIDPPRLMRFRLPAGVGYLRLWAVYDEQPSDPEAGYLVVYDPRADEFGLATKPSGKRLGCLIGYYGESLRDAVEAM